MLADQLRTARNTRVPVEQVEGVLAARAGISVGDAFTRIRGHARSNGLPPTRVATAVVNGSPGAGDLPG